MERAIEAFFFDPDYLAALADRHAPAYSSGEPFPHIVIDDFLPADALERVLCEFPSPTDEEWLRWKLRTERKLQTTAERGMGPTTRQVLNQFNSSAVIDFLEPLTGIDHLVPDPHYLGGGLHQIERGGYLKIHADFNHHPRLDLERRLNLLLYANHDWREEWGGYLELWDREMQAPVHRIAPIFNRCVIFNTTSFAYHGHPEPLTCPEGVTRKSIALYYYTKSRPAEDVKPAHTTIFKSRPDEARLTSRESVKRALKQWVPPAVTNFARRHHERDG